MKDHTTPLVEGHTQRSDPAGEAVRRQRPQFLGAQPRRVRGELRTLAEPGRARLLEVHLQDVDVREPEVAIGPHPWMPLPAAGQGDGGAVRVQDHGGAAVLLDVPQRRLAHLVVGDRDAYERVGVEDRIDVGGQDGVHEARLPLDPTVVFDVAQLDDVPLIGLGRYPRGVDIRVRAEDLLDRVLVPPPDVRNGNDRVVAAHQRREGDGRVQHAAVLLEPFAGVGHDLVAWNGAQHGDLTTRPRSPISRHGTPPGSRRRKRG